MRDRATENDFPSMRLDIETLAAAEPSRPHDLAGKPNRQVFSPSANSNLRHHPLRRVQIFSSYLFWRFDNATRPASVRRKYRVTSFRGAGTPREPGIHEHQPVIVRDQSVFLGSGPAPMGHPGMTS